MGELVRLIGQKAHSWKSWIGNLMVFRLKPYSSPPSFYS
jgi:hypothetical protein